MSGIETGLLVTAVLGTGAQVYGGISGASSQASAMEKNAALKNAQADELLARQGINEKIMKEQADFEALHAGNALGGNFSGVGQVLAIHKTLSETIDNTRRDADFKAKMLRAGAEIDTQLASDVRTASYFTGAGTVLGTGADIYKLYRPKTDPKALP